MAAPGVSKTRSGGVAATSTTVPGDGLSSADEGPSTDGGVPPSGRVIGERLVDVRRQRLSAAGRQLTTDTKISRTEAEAGSSTVETEVSRTAVADVEPVQDLSLIHI